MSGVSFAQGVVAIDPVPPGGTTGQVLTKTSNDDYAIDWQDTGAGGSVTQIIAGTNVTISPTSGTGAVTINATGGGSGAVSSVNGQTGVVVLTASDVGAVAAGTLATVATTGAYSDLIGKPTIPAAQVNSDWNATTGIAQILNKPSLATVATTGAYSDLTGKPTLGTAAAANTTDFATAAQGTKADSALQPTAIGVTVQAYDADLTSWAAIAPSAKQDTLVSGTSIKTVNSTSLLGSGDVAVQPTLVSGTNIKTVNSNSLLGSGNVAVQDTLVSGTNIKTINGNSVLGSGNLTISGGSGSPGGADTQVQFNSAGAFGGSAGFTWDGTTAKATNLEAFNGILADGTFSGTFVDGVTIDYTSGMGRISVGGSDGIEFYNGGVATNLLGHVSSGGNWDFNGSVTAGTGTPIGGATNPLIVSAGASSGYIQNYIVNNTNGASSSADIACYPHNGSDASGWIDMGITSQSYADTSYTVTGANEGYIFMSAPSGSSTSGSLIVATDSTGSANDIQFYTGGFAQGKTTPNLIIKGSTKNVGIEVANPTAALHLPAGTATASTGPLKFSTGTLLTTAESGVVEYDGKLQYFTPAGTARTLTPNAYYYRKNTATTLSSATGNQSIFGLTSGVTLQGSTLYEVEGEFELTTTGTTSHTESFGFVLTTATVSGMGVAINRLAATTTSSALGGYLTAVTPVVVTGALTTAQTVIYRIKGSIGISTAGSINPVLAFSAAPGGTSTVVAGAWFKFTPIGTTGSNVSIGTWA